MHFTNSFKNELTSCSKNKAEKNACDISILLLSCRKCTKYEICAKSAQVTNFVFSHQDFSKECLTKKVFTYFSTKTYVVGTEKNRLNETFF